MAASGKGDHLDVTANSFRQEVISLATIKLVEDLSPTVKKLTLVPQQPNQLLFKAGQWVDFFIPNVWTVGGFSMCSAPQKLTEEGILELAIKYSEHPPAKWVHTRCRPGDAVGMKVGGNFFFDPLAFSALRPNDALPLPPPLLLLVAGGVGINPILSILEEFSANMNNGVIDPDSRATLLYSASKREELLFKDKIDEIAKSTPGVSVHYFVTKEKDDSTAFDWRRINQTDLAESIGGDSSSLLSYICGPPTMIDGLVQSFRDLGVEDKNVHFEKWW